MSTTTPPAVVGSPAPAGHGRPGHEWRIVAPWYRWARADGLEPERATEANRPVLQKYASTAFVADFLRDPQRFVAFDPDLDVHQTVERVPAAELEGAGGRLRSLSATRLVPSDTRKLFLPAHQRFYLVTAGLHCDRPGYPKVDAASVGEIGFVVRRRRVEVPKAERVRGAAILRELTTARAVLDARTELDAAKERSRVLHPFAAPARKRVASVRRATGAAYREVDAARRRLRVWAEQVGVADRTEAWVASGDGSFGAWVGIEEEPTELVERWYPLRLLTPDPDDPDHAAHDGTVYYGAVPTASDEVTADGRSRFDSQDTYEIRVFARSGDGDCPGPLVWSEPSRPFRVASFYDPAGSAQRPLEIRLPDFSELQASTAVPSVRMSAPESSTLEFSKFGGIPTKGRVSTAEEICFFSIPLITIIALFVLNLFLPVVMVVFQLWWMLTLRFCIPPSADFELELAGELDVTPPELEAVAELDVDVLPGVDQDGLRATLASIFNPGDPDPGLDRVDPPYLVGDEVTKAPDPANGVPPGFTNDPLVKLAVRRGFGSPHGGTPQFHAPAVLTTPVRRDQVVHP